jgi:hypothetical protein
MVLFCYMLLLSVSFARYGDGNILLFICVDIINLYVFSKEQTTCFIVCG